MKRSIRLSAFLLLAACSASVHRPPSNIDNACTIVRERPSWLSAMRRTERRWGAPVPEQLAIIHQESKFRGRARTPRRYVLGIIPMGRRSSAYGYSQALDATWVEYRRATGRWGARRARFSDASDFMGWYIDQSNKKLGIRKSDTRNQYLAYHEGQAGFARGYHRRKPWLLRVASRVSARAARYRAQLASCGRL